MAQDITHSLPKTIADYIAACNAHDIEAWMATLAPDALLNDVSREFIGAEAIRGFAAKEICPTSRPSAVATCLPPWTRIPSACTSGTAPPIRSSMPMRRRPA